MPLGIYPLLLAAAGLATLAACDPDAQPRPDTVTLEPDTSLAGWLRSTPLRAPVGCAMEEPDGTPEVPWFTFNNRQTRETECLIDGPYSWNEQPWFVLRITNLSSDSGPMDSVRVCSVAAKRPGQPETPFPSPCGGDAGPGGCKICMRRAHQP
jgi:hypothetical protein